MKIIRRGSGAALVALCGLFSIAGSATEILNIPASAAQPGVDEIGYNCYFDATTGFTTTDNLGHCVLDYPLMIPAGHTIKQIAIVHDDNGIYPDPYIWAGLVPRDITNGTYDVKFPWSSPIPVPDGTLQSALLMKQVGKTYPDAFVVQTNLMYHVKVQLNNGATNYGIWVVYE